LRSKGPGRARTGNQERAGRGVLEHAAALGADMGSSQGHHADRHRDGPHPVAGVVAYPVRHPAGHRPGAHRAVRRQPRQGPPDQLELWARAALLAVLLAVWVLTIWIIIR